jgi:Histidyl-tRNA synthetase
MLSRVYSFLDWDGWSGERVVLRPDGTIPVARLYGDNLSESETARLFYVTNIFAFEETGKENRERWQCGAEFFGGAKFTTDAEIILLAEEIVRRLGLKSVELQLFHAGLVNSLIKELKLSPDEEVKVKSRVLDGDWRALMEAKSVNPEANRLLSQFLGLKGKSSSFLQNVKALSQQVSPDFKSSLEDFINITTLLDGLNCGYKIDITAMRGFEYYTGACFQLLAGGEKVAGGGRYDNLVPLMSGRDIPACGCALYIDSVMKLLPLKEKEKGECEILIRGEELTPEIVKTCFTLAQSLRDAGYTTKLGFTGQEKIDYRWVIQVSEKEPSPFILTDYKQKQRRDVTSVAEVLNILSKE